MAITTNPTATFAPPISPIGSPYGSPYGNPYGGGFGQLYGTNAQYVNNTVTDANSSIAFNAEMTRDEIDYQTQRALANRAFTRAINEVTDAISKTKNAQSTIGGAAGQ